MRALIGFVFSMFCMAIAGGVAIAYICGDFYTGWLIFKQTLKSIGPMAVTLFTLSFLTVYT